MAVAQWTQSPWIGWALWGTDAGEILNKEKPKGCPRTCREHHLFSYFTIVLSSAALTFILHFPVTFFLAIFSCTFITSFAYLVKRSCPTPLPTFFLLQYLSVSLLWQGSEILVVTFGWEKSKSSLFSKYPRAKPALPFKCYRVGFLLTYVLLLGMDLALWRMGSLTLWWSIAQATSRPGPQQVGKLDFSHGAAGLSQSLRKLADIYHVPGMWTVLWYKL